MREVLILDPGSGHPEVWRLQGGEYRLIPPPMVSAVTGLEYRQGAGALEVRDPQSGRSWTIPVE